MTHGWPFLGIVALCVGQAAMIGMLLVRRGRRSRDEDAELPRTLAHELSQPLTAILANAQAASRLLELEPPDLAEVRQCLVEIVESDKHAAGIIHRLRSTSKPAHLAHASETKVQLDTRRRHS